MDVNDSNAVYYYHFDGLGSVVALSDVNNVIVESYSYDVFGAPTIYDVNYTEISPSAVGNPYMFTARRADDETALYYYRARYYAFDIGRFLQTDPIGYNDGLNLYTYVQNNPVCWVDPYGLVTGVEEAAAVSTVASWTGWGFGGYMTAGGTFISSTGVGLLATGTAAASGAVGYGISKVAVIPVIDWVADAVYDSIVNKDTEKYPLRKKTAPTRKTAKDIARRLGPGEPIPHGPHGPGQKSHWHPADNDGNKLTGRRNWHIEYPFSFMPFLLLPDDDDVKKTDDDGGKK